MGGGGEGDVEAAGSATHLSDTFLGIGRDGDVEAGGTRRLPYQAPDNPIARFPSSPHPLTWSRRGRPRQLLLAPTTPREAEGGAAAQKRRLRLLVVSGTGQAFGGGAPLRQSAGHREGGAAGGLKYAVLPGTCGGSAATNPHNKA